MCSEAVSDLVEQQPGLQNYSDRGWASRLTLSLEALIGVVKDRAALEAADLAASRLALG